MDFTKFFNDVGSSISGAVNALDNAGYDLLRESDKLLFGGLKAVFGNENRIINGMEKMSTDAVNGLQGTFGLDPERREQARDAGDEPSSTSAVSAGIINAGTGGIVGGASGVGRALGKSIRQPGF